MKYISTRDHEARHHTFEQAIMAGWAGDGGMFLPACIPVLSLADLEAWRCVVVVVTSADNNPYYSPLTYAQLAARFLRLFISSEEIGDGDLDDIVSRSFDRFGNSAVVSVKRVSTSSGDNSTVNVCELWHGPTLAFKDLGLQLLGKLLDFFLKKSGSRLTVLVGTSGDTGSSAAEAVRGSSCIDIFVLFPKVRQQHAGIVLLMFKRQFRHPL